MKRICILLNGGIKYDQRVIKTIKSLSSKYEIDLFYINGENDDSKLFESNVKLCNNQKKRNPNWFNKVLRNSLFFFEFNFFIKYVKKKNEKYDYIWCNDLPTLYPGYKLSKYYKCKLIYDSHEIFNETLNQFFPIKQKLRHKLSLKFMQYSGRFMEKYLIKRIDEFVTVNSSLASYFKKHFNYKKQITVIYNYPNKVAERGTERENIRKKIGFSKNDFVLIFQGTLNQGRGLHILLKAIQKLEKSDIKLMIIGGGPLLQEIKDIVENRNLQNKIKVLGKIHSQELYKFTNIADCGINLLDEINLSKKFTTATKMFEYFQAGIPIICSDIVENKNIFKQFEAGILTRNEVIELRENIIKMSKSSNIEKYKMNSLKASKEYYWERQESILFKLFDD